MKNYKTIIAVSAAALVCSVASTSHAALTVNNNGSTVPIDPSGTHVDATVPTASPTASLVTTFNNPPQIGTLASYVLTGDTANPYGASGLTFVYKASESASGTTFIDNISLNGFGGLSQVSVANEGTGAAATTASLFGGVLTIHFADDPTLGINPGQSSDWLFVYTSSIYYGQTTGNANDGSVGTSGILAPVPEPSTIAAGALMLLPLGIGAMRSLRKDRTV